MTYIQRRGLIGGALGLAAGAVMGAMASGAQARMIVGEPAPKFTLRTFDRQKISLPDLIGQVVVLNYWATWCVPCRAEMLLIDTYVRRRGAGGLKVFAIATESSVPDSYLKPLAKVLSFPLVSNLYGGGYGTINDAVPTNYVIDRAGTLRYAKAGAFSVESFDALISPLLAEAPPTPSTQASI